MKKLILSLLLFTNLWGSSSTTKYPVFPKRISPELSTVPNSLTAVTSTDSQIFQISVANNTAGTCTFLVQDTAGKVLIPTVSVAANTAYVIVYPEGAHMTSGIKWQAGTSSCLDASINGFYK